MNNYWVGFHSDNAIIYLEETLRSLETPDYMIQTLQFTNSNNSKVITFY